MPAADWDRTNGELFLITDDGGNDKLLIDASTTGWILRNDFAAQANMRAEAIIKTLSTKSGFQIGVRLNGTAGPNHGDGYWAGFTYGNGGTKFNFAVFERSAGVLTQLGVAAGLAQAGQEFDIIVLCEGTTIQAFLKRKSTGQVIMALSVENSIHVADGFSGVARFADGETGRIFIDDFITKNVA